VNKSFSGKVRKGRVIGQKVKPGTVLPEGAQVGLKVSKGEK
jgi:beta-lactam-binding protein with PASTA domain